MSPIRHHIIWAICALGFVLVSFSPNANAQATRTWVSGAVGDDVNPCSRTAPGKTFAGAISKTAVGGTINAIDPGGYGTVTITKSITIDGAGTMASILASATNGVNINAPGGFVVLKDLIIDGTSASNIGINGVRIIDAAIVYIDRCTITTFQNGIKVEGGGQVIVKDCVIRNCTVSGINDSPAAAAFTDIHQTRIEGCKAGLLVNGNVHLTGTRVSAVGCTEAAVSVQADGSVTLTDSTIANNGAGLVSEGAMYVGTSLITNNVGAGLSATKPGFIRSLKGNQLFGNAPDGKFSKAIPQR